MNAKKQIGIWMDHSVAHLMEMNNGDIITRTLVSEVNKEEKENGFQDKGEYLMHNKEQSLQVSYYHKISEAIKGYEGILLFGPTDAKTELLNLLSSDHHFENKKMEALPADKMTENQQHAFVKNYFKSHK